MNAGNDCPPSAPQTSPAITATVIPASSAAANASPTTALRLRRSSLTGCQGSRYSGMHAMQGLTVSLPVHPGTLPMPSLLCLHQQPQQVRLPRGPSLLLVCSVRTSHHALPAPCHKQHQGVQQNLLQVSLPVAFAAHAGSDLSLAQHRRLPTNFMKCAVLKITHKCYK